MRTNPPASPKIFFSSTLFTPFIEQDEILLSRHYRLERLIARGLSAVLRIPGAVLRSDITLSWFGSVYAGYTVLLARLFGRRSVVVVAGIDASKDREIKYGIWLNPFKSVFVRYAFRHADRVLPVAPFMQREVIRLAEYDGANVAYIPFGFDDNEWKPGDRKIPMVLTVAACHDKWRLKKKGIDKLLLAARSLSSVPFCIIGIHKNLVAEVARELPPNVELIPFVPRRDLLSYYQKAKVYCQPSFTEGLPNTLCEAMLCGCIPVATIAGGIPTVMGEEGCLVNYGDVPALVDGLRTALSAHESEGGKARRRISSEFPLAKRERMLCQVIEELWK